MNCPECGAKLQRVPCPDGLEGCLVAHLGPCECTLALVKEMTEPHPILQEIGEAITQMRARLESGQGNASDAMCRLSLTMAEVLWKERERTWDSAAGARRVLNLLDERVALLKGTSLNPSCAPYFEGRHIGEMAATEMAADALRRALGEEHAGPRRSSLRPSVSQYAEQDRSGLYANAVGRIECALGLVGSFPVHKTISAVERLVAQRKQIENLLSENGCDCDCEHHWEEHDEDCERCLSCRISEAMSHGW